LSSIGDHFFLRHKAEAFCSSQGRRKIMALIGKLKNKTGKEGLFNLLIAQFFLVVLLYFAVVFQDAPRPLTISGTFILMAAILYFSYKGIRTLWLNKKSGRK